MNLLDYLVFAVKRFATGVFYLLTGQWDKMIELASNEDLRKRKR